MAKAPAAILLLMMLAGCDRGERTALETRNAELQADKARLEQTLTELRVELEKMKTAQAAAAVRVTQLEPAATPTDESALEAAQDAYVHGNYKDAVTLAKKAVTTSPAKAWRIVGAAECFRKNTTGALDAYHHLGEQEREFLRYVCARNAIKLN